MGTCSSAGRAAGGQKLQLLLREVLNESAAVRLPWSKTKSEHGFLSWGRCPQTPGIYRFGARMAVVGAAGVAPPFRRLGQRSGRIPALPYPLPR